MNIAFPVYKLLVLLAAAIPVAAAPFQNLNFEATTLQRDGPFGYQPIDAALPGWRALIGPDETTNVLFNALTVGAPFVGLSGTSFPVLQGEFSALLGSSASTDVSIFQAGHIPDDAQSLRFLGVVGYAFGPPMPLNSLVGVFVNSQQLAITDAFSEPGIFNYSADISAFAGQDVTLTFTSHHLIQYPNSLILDSISFSPTPVPEPSTWALLVCAGGFLALWHWRKKVR